MYQGSDIIGLDADGSIHMQGLDADGTDLMQMATFTKSNDHHVLGRGSGTCMHDSPNDF
jgi:hypothetical protein